MARVYVTGAGDRADRVRRLVEAVGLEGYSRETVVLKANYNSADPFPASTHTGTLQALLEVLRHAGAGQVTLLERSGMGETREVLERCGVFRLLARSGARAEVLDELPAGGWVHIPAGGSHWRDGFYLPRALLAAGRMVQTCCLKTHRFGGHFTLSLKNSVGLVARTVPGLSQDFMHELHRSPHQRLMIAEINRAYPTHLALMDANLGFSRGGPEQGEVIRPGLMLASSDRVALDAAGVSLLRLHGATGSVSEGRVFGLEQIARAAAIGVGVAGPGEVDVVALDREGEEAAARIGQLLREEG